MNNNTDSKSELIEGLKQAARGRNRFKKARLEEVLDDVETAVAAGVSHKEIVAVLGQRGLVMSEGVFAVTRSRILKKRGMVHAPAKGSEAAGEAAPNPPAASQQKPITGDDIKNSLRGPINLKQYD